MAHLLPHAAVDADSALDLDGLMRSFVALSLLIALIAVWGLTRRPDRNGFEAAGISVSEVELPREWLWTKAPKNFDRMFRQVH